MGFRSSGKPAHESSLSRGRKRQVCGHQRQVSRISLEFKMSKQRSEMFASDRCDAKCRVKLGTTSLTMFAALDSDGRDHKFLVGQDSLFLLEKVCSRQGGFFRDSTAGS